MRVLLSHVVDDTLNDLVALLLALENGTGIGLLHLRLEAASGNLVVASTHGLELGVLIVDLGALKLLVEHAELLITEVLTVLVVLVLFVVNVV